MYICYSKITLLRYFVELSYKGTNYHGWQIQPDAISVQEKVNNAFSKILNTPINVVAAGRTDTGVHASQMFVHLDSDIKLDTSNYLYKINAVLPDDIVVYSIFRVGDNAHTRFDAINRSYEYHIYQGRNPFNLETSWQIHHQVLDIKAMNNAASILKNYTSFKCFSKSKTDVKTYDCNIVNAEWKQQNNTITFYITANRFLRNMVRAIVGTLVEIGLGKKNKQDFVKIIESQNRSNAGSSAPAKGLFLTKVEYPETIIYE